MAGKKKQVKGPVLQSTDDVDKCLGALATLTVETMDVEAALNAELTAVRDLYQERLQNLRDDCEAEVMLLKQWAEANPQLFEEKKSMALTYGVIGFRTGNPTVRFLKGVTEDIAIGLLSAKPEWKDRYVRELVEINKAAIIEDREALKDALADFGLRVTQSETFYADPKMEPKG